MSTRNIEGLLILTSILTSPLKGPDRDPREVLVIDSDSRLIPSRNCGIQFLQIDSAA